MAENLVDIPVEIEDALLEAVTVMILKRKYEETTSFRKKEAYKECLKDLMLPNDDYDFWGR